jgi:hypothetical protein
MIQILPAFEVIHSLFFHILQLSSHALTFFALFLLPISCFMPLYRAHSTMMLGFAREQASTSNSENCLF